MRTGERNTGFTLLELLVVIFIIGIIAAMATLSVGTATSSKGVEAEAGRIGDLVRLASEEAVIQGREFGLTFYRREYVFSSYDAGRARWVPLDAGAAGPLAGSRLPPEAEMEVRIEDRLVALAEQRPPPPKEADEDEPGLGRDDNAPQVFIFSSGDVTPFEVRLRPGIGQAGVTLSVDETGNVEQARDDA